MTVELIGDKDLIRKINRLGVVAEKELAATLSKLAFSTQSIAIQSIQTSPGSGRAYRRGSNIRHVASSPGNPPRTDTGNLVSNITVDRKSLLDYDVGSRKGAPYGFWLEFGTRNIAKRPWLNPAYQKTVAQLPRFIPKGLR